MTWCVVCQVGDLGPAHHRVGAASEVEDAAQEEYGEVRARAEAGVTQAGLALQHWVFSSRGFGGLKNYPRGGMLVRERSENVG